MNIGANSVTDNGLFFAWGETQGYTAEQVGVDKNFVESDYKYYDNSSYTYTKYNNSDGLITLQSSDDAVTAAWGGNWRTPTMSEWRALGEAVNSAWTNDYQGSGVSGLVCTDKTDSSKVLFFPAVGSCYDDEVSGVGEDGYYWSNSRVSDDEYIYVMNFSIYGMYWDYDTSRCYGYAVRGVLDE